MWGMGGATQSGIIRGAGAAQPSAARAENRRFPCPCRERGAGRVSSRPCHAPGWAPAGPRASPVLRQDLFIVPASHKSIVIPHFQPRQQYGNIVRAGIPGARIAMVINNQPRAPAGSSSHARAASPPQSSTTSPTPTAPASTRRSPSASTPMRPDLVVLAGFMRVLGDGFVRRYEPPAQHPPLAAAGLPGLHTHRRARDRGEGAWRERAFRHRRARRRADRDPGAIAGADGRRRGTSWPRACWRRNTSSTRAVRWFVGIGSNSSPTA